MNDEILEMLDMEIARLFEELNSLEPGSQAYGVVEQDLLSLLGRRDGLISNQNSHKEIEEKKKDRLIGYAIDGVKAIGAAGLFIWMTVAGFKFEETGTFRSNTFKEGRSNMFRSVFRK